MTLTGNFDDRLWPIIKIKVGSKTPPDQELDFLLDTGFNQTLAISKQTFMNLGPDELTVRTILTAGGPTEFRTCLMYATWDNLVVHTVEAIVCEMDAVGNQLMLGLRLEMEFAEAGPFRLSQIPETSAIAPQ